MEGERAGKMLLVTTADQRTWDKHQTTLFLGEWCKKYSEKAVWKNIQHKVLPYHWDDRTRLFHDYSKIQIVYEKYLEKVAEKFNNLHGVDYSLRYWRILIGPWLNYFISIVFDRYCSIKKAVKTNGLTGTIILDFSPKKMVPPDMMSFANYFGLDEWNHFIYGQLIEEFDNVAFNIDKIQAAPLVNQDRDGDIIKSCV